MRAAGTAGVRVLVTGAGGPAAIAAMRSLSADRDIQLLAADMDPWAAGLYLVPPDRRTIIPPGHAGGFAESLLSQCVQLGVDVLLPTVDSELEPVARAADAYADAGIWLLLASAPALGMILDKLLLARRCAGVVHVPRTEPFGAELDPADWEYPVIVKPRRGSGSRGVRTIDSASALGALYKQTQQVRSPDERPETLIVQEYLPGLEYSIDVLADAGGQVMATVPRVRERVDSGVSVAGRTVHDPELEKFGCDVVRWTGLTFVANVQCRLDRDGRPALLEVNPRVPGTLGLTIASGVDMPRLALDSLLGRPVPEQVGFREVAVVRFLDERFIEPAEVLTVDGRDRGRAMP